MDFKKLTIFFAAIFSFLVFWGGAQVFKTKASSPYTSDSLFTYIMPKLSQYIPKFSLFDRTFIDDTKKLAPKSNATSNQVMNNIVKPNSPVAAVKPAIPPAPPAATTQSNNLADDSESDNKNQANNKDKENSNEDDQPTKPEAALNSGPKSPQAPEKPSEENQITDWKSKILSNPTREVMSEFVYEFETEKITREVFYQVMEELVKEHNSEIQELTLFGLSGVQSYDSLSFLLKHRDDYFGNAASMYKRTLATYERTDKLKLLIKALNSGDAEVVLGVMPVISKVGSKLTEWTSDFSSHSDDRRDQRGPANRLPKGELIQLIKILENLQDSKDHQIALEARETLSEINYHPPPPSETTVSLSDQH